MTSDRIERILNYWFGDLEKDPIAGTQDARYKKWFRKSGQTDREIRENFEADLIKAAAGDYKEWEQSFKGRLALIILFDQFSRNIYRDTPGAFKTDPHALDLCLRCLDLKDDTRAHPVENIFLYLPLEHSESLEMQGLSLCCYENLLQRVEKEYPEMKKLFEGTLDYAKRHENIIRRFKRFPHRNKILGRESAEEEIEFLKKPGSSF